MLLFAGDGVQGLQFPMSGGFQIQNFKRKTEFFFLRPLGCLPFWLRWPKPLRGLVCYSISTQISTHRFQCVASTMCSSATIVITSHPSQTQSQLLRSNNHVFKCNEWYHIPPHHKPNCYVASTMCSSATNVITSHPTPPQKYAFGHGVANPALSFNNPIGNICSLKLGSIVPSFTNNDENKNIKTTT